MRKLLVFSVVLVSMCLVNAWSQQTMVNICMIYGMQKDKAMAFTADLIEECTFFNMDYKPLFLIAIAETGLKNVIGDSGAAVGYFQLHKETCWFVQHKYSLKIPQNHLELAKNPKLQIQIAVRYFHYLSQKYDSLDAILQAWNGSTRYVTYFKQVAEYVEQNYVR